MGVQDDDADVDDLARELTDVDASPDVEVVEAAGALAAESAAWCARELPPPDVLDVL
ncbi:MULTISPECIES: hypothetical protein [unclassified Nocardia]|uniref:hypothetical protein n=1 Tax=unclassified Nocardia TaxID=2637762 RepID=UPI00278C219C|nr:MULTISPECIES: hypothetical protein [unclassified Nocardia]